jgi:Zn-dependent protease
MKIPHIKLGTAFGIEILLHWSFFALPIVIVAVSVRQGDSIGLIGVRLVLMTMILASVLWHELGHALAARIFGIPTRDIMLTPICGLARLERAPKRPRDEIMVALAGPLSNGLVAAVTSLLALGLGQSLALGREILDLRILTAVFWINVSLFAINLAPIFPMDGGRVFRAVLQQFACEKRATWIAVRSGQLGSVIAIGWGLMAWNAALVLIGLFLLIAAQQELVVRERPLPEIEAIPKGECPGE